MYLSMELSLSRTFAPGSESSMYGNFAPRSENVMELSLLGAKWKLSLPVKNM